MTHASAQQSANAPKVRFVLLWDVWRRAKTMEYARAVFLSEEMRENKFGLKTKEDQRPKTKDQGFTKPLPACAHGTPDQQASCIIRNYPHYYGYSQHKRIFENHLTNILDSRVR